MLVLDVVDAETGKTVGQVEAADVYACQWAADLSEWPAPRYLLLYPEPRKDPP